MVKQVSALPAVRLASAHGPRLPEWARKGEPPRSRRARPARAAARAAADDGLRRGALSRTSGECFSRGTATFMLLGDRCTRRCGYCSVSTGAAPAARPGRARRGWRKRRRACGLRYVVLTAVARDDLGDGGAAPFRGDGPRRAAAPARGPRRGPHPRLQGRPAALAAVLGRGAGRLQPQHRDGAAAVPARCARRATTRAACACCGRAKRHAPGQVTKSGLMVGLGETDDEIADVLCRPARARGVDIADPRPVPAAHSRRTRRWTATCRPTGSSALGGAARAASGFADASTPACSCGRPSTPKRSYHAPSRAPPSGRLTGSRRRGAGRRSPASCSRSPSRSTATGLWPGSPSRRCSSPSRARRARATASGSAT